MILQSSNRIDHNATLLAFKVNESELCWMKNQQLMAIFIILFIKTSAEKLLFCRNI